MSPAAESPIIRLVVFIACLALVGSIIGGAHFYLVDLPQQEALSEQTPANANSDTKEKCDSCRSRCPYGPEGSYYQCLLDCEAICN